MLRVFIGYDKVETVAYHVCAESIIRHSSQPVSITPLYLEHLRHYHHRPRDPKQSTEFAFTRFLVPYLCDYKGLALFVDGDMIVKGDIAELFAMAEKGKAVSVVKRRNYKPSQKTKFLDQQQTTYERKNWSSVMLFNNPECLALTPKYIDEASGLDLHQFKWLEDNQIGELPKQWNHLVGEDAHNDHAKLIHYTNGTPCFLNYSRCDYSEDWRREKASMLAHVDVEARERFG